MGTQFIETREKNDYKSIFSLKAFKKMQTIATDDTNIYINIHEMLRQHPKLVNVNLNFDCGEVAGLFLLSQCSKIPQWWWDLYPRTPNHPVVDRILKRLQARKRIIKSIPMFQSFKELSDKAVAWLLAKISLNYYMHRINTNGIENVILNLPISFACLNHSCSPNVIIAGIIGVECSKPYRSVLVAIKPIKKNEELFFSYLKPDELKLSKTERQTILMNGWGFNCTCQRCQAE